MKRRDLEAALAAIPPHPSPSPALEQYVTPSAIATDFLWQARDELEGCRVLDLGCGTGVLSIGAALLGAVEVVGVDVDAASVALARQEAERRNLPCTFVVNDLREDDAKLGASFDVVVMNPPFGAQRGNRGGDRVFYDVAMAALRPGGACWLLAPTVSQRFLAAYARDARWRIEQIGVWDYPLPATMDHHKEAVRSIRVGGYRLAAPAD